ncbi:carbon-monoxide dehydrogenase small subunit [Evansella caseinilytica]|uniref:Carbon-monoxide dehydrogenase small subunit n=1 Tax=Evansella caseinilytica TaxID=1503961 RepID=A0A1H3NZX6_9BACI|nr:(2Fe-2S)-binding protein [Evansella caseinilytica]SDY94095.1 carbon-monoxide dehydrogenase small subunit [Evansella caseinilytica]
MTIVSVTLMINGEERTTEIRYADILLTVLREKFGLTGSKPGCLNGDCGACTVHVNGKPMKSCLMLAIEAVGEDITTIEGLKGTPIQQAFIQHFAFQCGYCTPGFIMNCQALIQAYPDAGDKVIKEWLESNICRCTSYEEIEAAVKSVLRSEA